MHHRNVHYYYYSKFSISPTCSYIVSSWLILTAVLCVYVCGGGEGGGREGREITTSTCFTVTPFHIEIPLDMFYNNYKLNTTCIWIRDNLPSIRMQISKQRPTMDSLWRTLSPQNRVLPKGATANVPSGFWVACFRQSWKRGINAWQDINKQGS